MARQHRVEGRSASTATDTASPSSSTSVTLSDEAKAYLAQTAADGEQPSAATLATRARAWFDQQYVALGTSSAMLDGQVAVDFSGQTRATLSVIAGKYAEPVLAGRGDGGEEDIAVALQRRRVAPCRDCPAHRRLCKPLRRGVGLSRSGRQRREGNGGLEDQKQAVLEGLAAARASFGKAPVTGNAADPVRALLDKAPTQTPSATDTSPDTLVANARAMLDAQAGSARDNGKDLVFTGGRQTGQQVDFTDFDNRTLAVMALNADASFSAQEASAAKAELNSRTRSSLVNAFGGDGIRASSLALLQQYQSMSTEERSVLGFTDDYANRIIANYRTAASIQNSPGAGAGLAAYL
jgi:hypothetical protein